MIIQIGNFAVYSRELSGTLTLTQTGNVVVLTVTVNLHSITAKTFKSIESYPSSPPGPQVLAFDVYKGAEGYCCWRQPYLERDRKK